MSDVSQGPGWWQASDGKWYPPEQAPGGQPAAATPPADPWFGGAPTAPGAGFGTPGAVAPGAGYGVPGGAPVYGGPAAGAPGMSQYGTLATWGQRAVAILIDWAFGVGAYIAFFIVGAIFGAISSALGAIVFLIGYIVVTAWWFYIAFLNGEGASPGKKLTGLKVISIETGQPIGGGMGIVRGLAHIVDSLVCYIGWFMPLWDKDRQTIADKIIKTFVLADQPKEDFSLEIFKPKGA